MPRNIVSNDVQKLKEGLIMKKLMIILDGNTNFSEFASEHQIRG